jgi:8-oxo-dGTP pyrophosphatase MutT (NUDIX family)
MSGLSKTDIEVKNRITLEYKSIRAMDSVCNNCGKVGHLFQHCKLPINSYGIIAFTFLNDASHLPPISPPPGLTMQTTTPTPTPTLTSTQISKPKFLMIRRKDSFGYIDFVRGKYSPYNISQLQKIVDEMNMDEKGRLLAFYDSPEPTAKFFNRLWTTMWGESSPINKRIEKQYRNEEETAMKKFEIIARGIILPFSETPTHAHAHSTMLPSQTTNLRDIILSSQTNWTDAEWEFPKGRRNTPKEKEIDCAFREFEEETGISCAALQIVDNVVPYEETFIGTNCKAYKYKYFLAYIAPKDIVLTRYQQNEVSKLECVTLEEAHNYIRHYSVEKKNIIQHINNTIMKYQFVTPNSYP